MRQCSDGRIATGDVRAVPVGSSLALSPPLVITEAEIHELFDRVEVALQRASAARP
jgi:adenosylmethionine-8-amino-7-oxononanoate aminotransferase